MVGELTISAIATQENLAIAKSVCSGLKAILAGFKKNNLTYKAQIQKLQLDLDRILAEHRMKNSTALYTYSMKQIQLFMRQFDLDSMTQYEEKIFLRKLENLNDDLDSILEQYSKGLS